MRLPSALAERIEAALGAAPGSAKPMAGGCIADVQALDLADGRRVVAKIAPEGGLGVEAFMLTYLAEHSPLPVPAVLLGADDLLVMTRLESGGRLDAAAQADAAGHVAALHAVTAESFGLERDTLIGPLHQPNPETERWIDFFRDQRLLYMGRVALDAGELPRNAFDKLERFCGRLDRYISEPPAPALLHGDLWAGNILAARGRIGGFVDPAIYYGHPEMDLAFATLFGSLGEPFFERYAELAPLPEGFFEVRRDIYNLYPLLVHTALFGGGYAGGVARSLDRLA